MSLNQQELSWFQDTFALGHFRNPQYKDETWGVTYNDLPNLDSDSEACRFAIQSRCEAQILEFSKFVAEDHNRFPTFDNNIGPSVTKLFEEERCLVPDWALLPEDDVSGIEDPNIRMVCERMRDDIHFPAVGVGNWKECHNVGKFHCCTVGVDDRSLSSHLQNGVLLEVLKRVQKAYAKVGLLFLFIKDGKDMITGKPFNGVINTNMSFVGSAPGWIGLAIVGYNQTCRDTIWNKYLKTYTGGNSREAVITQWVTLVKHELGHNCGRGHTQGGVMNPGIVNNLPNDWVPSDPSYNWLRQQFGGETVGVDNPDNPPPTTGLDLRVKTLEEELATIKIRTAIHEAMLQYLLSK